MIALIAFVGLRYEVGTDWGNYIRIHHLLDGQSLVQVLTNAEPMSYLVMWLSQWIGFGIYGTNVVCAIILMAGVFSFARAMPNPWLAVVAAIPFLVFVVGMSATRQAMAVGVALMGLSRWAQLSIRSRVAWILLATMFHLSAAIMLALVPISSGLRLYNRLLLVFAGLFLPILGDALLPDLLSSYKSSYVSGQNIVIASGAVFHLLLIIIPALIFLTFRRRLAPHTPMPSLISYGALAAMAMLVILPFSTVIASRVSNFLYFVPMAVSAVLPQIFAARGRPILAVVIVGFNVLVLLVWMTLSNNAINHQDYQNILFLIP